MAQKEADVRADIARFNDTVRSNKASVMRAALRTEAETLGAQGNRCAVDAIDTFLRNAERDSLLRLYDVITANRV
jgi:hypothetical protein